MANIEETRRLLAELEEKTADSPEPVKLVRQEDQLRGTAALWILGLYALVLIFSLVIFFAQGNACTTDQVCSWDRASNNALELIKIGVMPIIALVIGFYFGRNNS